MFSPASLLGRALSEGLFPGTCSQAKQGLTVLPGA